MRDAPRQPAHGFQFLRLDQPGFGLFTCGNVTPIDYRAHALPINPSRKNITFESAAILQFNQVKTLSLRVGLQFFDTLEK